MFSGKWPENGAFGHTKRCARRWRPQDESGEAKAIALRPTVDNVRRPAGLTPVYLEAAAKVRDIFVDAGMPRR